MGRAPASLNCQVHGQQTPGEPGTHAKPLGHVGLQLIPRGAGHSASDQMRPGTSGVGDGGPLGCWWGLALQMRWARAGGASAEASVLVGIGVSCVADSSKLGDI